MNHILVKTSFIAIITGLIIFNPMASDARSPVFMDQYKTEKISNIPTIVRSKKPIQKQVVKRDAQDFFAKSQNPFQNTSFGRIRSEQEFYDKETGLYHNQYDYIALLASRGQTNAANNLARNLQQNGVYNHQKAQTVVQQKLAGTHSDAIAPIASPTAQQPNRQAGQNNQSASAAAAKQGKKTQASSSQSPSNNNASTAPSRAPIFLR